MNTTIAVALITACSTLAGGIIASITTLMAQGKQLRHQAIVAAQERSSQHSAQRREIRRNAYVELLNKSDESERAISSCWKMSPPTEDAFTSAYAVIASLNIPVNVIRMEGPPEMAALAQLVHFIFHEELIRAHQIFENNREAQKALIAGRDDEYGDSFGRRFQAKFDFADMAREVRGDASSEEPMRDHTDSSYLGTGRQELGN